MLGQQQPRILAVPPYAASSGGEAVELAAMAGLELDPWQQFVLRNALGEKPDGRWAAFEVGLVCPRQNGKNAILEARELAGLFLLGERLIIHSAHQADTSLEAWRRLKELIQNTPELDKRVRSYPGSHGLESIELKNGQRIRFRTRTKGGGRGFSGDCVVFDEAMIFPETSLAAILPIVSARPNAQVWYTGSAVDQEVHVDGYVLARKRARAIIGDDPSLAYFEWSLDSADPDKVPDDVACSPEAWAAANPAYGIRISREAIENEYHSFGRGSRSFAVERLGVGDWPDLDGSGGVIDLGQWKTLMDARSKPLDPVCLAFDVTPDRGSAAVAAAGLRADGLAHVEVIERRRGTGWIVERLAELDRAHSPRMIVCDSAGPVASLLPELERAGVRVTTTTTRAHAEACGAFYDAVQQARLRHLGTPDLDAAVRVATQRPIGDAWLWSRKNSGGDISPLVACTLALWGLSAQPTSIYEDRGLLTFTPSR